jgi:hypothetical protein
MEDLIAREDVVVTITRTGTPSAPRWTCTGRRSAAARGLRSDTAPGRHRQPLLRMLHARLDPVLHQQGPGLPGEGLRAARGSRVAKGQHVANCWRSSRTSKSPR